MVATGEISPALLLDPSEAESLAPIFKALADPVRLQMLAMIAAVPERCVCEISPAFELSSATVSHHLKVLRDSGLVSCERRGTFVYYRLQPQRMTQACACLSQVGSGHHKLDQGCGLSGDEGAEGVSGKDCLTTSGDT